MDKNEFIKLAKELGYMDDEIVDLVKLHDEDGIAFEDIELGGRIVD